MPRCEQTVDMKISTIRQKTLLCSWLLVKLCNYATVQENNYRHKTFSIDGQWLWDDAIKFARWQHHAMR